MPPRHLMYLNCCKGLVLITRQKRQSVVIFIYSLFIKVKTLAFKMSFFMRYLAKRSSEMQTNINITYQFCKKTGLMTMYNIM